ncbi:uncharacterized protein PAC_12522 [Phialocephala subalpina]|uniref:F-box domain-containing protein n=1 Tax=Phialocephala subalpina TaxID=576137 RepID=A0A1L7XC88_9HELO|nr:uncharacterized protein PAC_12522 [Phialocephala subalpina]
MDAPVPQNLSVEAGMLLAGNTALENDDSACETTATSPSPSETTYKPPLHQPYIWMLICEHADLSTCKQIRLVNRTADTPAAKQLFQEVFLMALPDCFEKLSYIASDAVVSKYVKKIVYMTDLLNPEYCDFAKWNQDAFRNEDVAKYRRYHDLFCMQQALLRGNSDISSLRSSMPLLKNLVSIDIISLGNLCQRFVHGPVPLAGRLFRETSISPTKSLLQFTISPDTAKPLEAYIRACSTKSTGIRNLTVDHCPWGFWQASRPSPQTYRPATFPRVRPLLGNAFLNLSSLTMTSYMGSMRIAKQGHTPIGELVTFLKAMPNLQHLSLKCLPLNRIYSNWSQAADTNLTGVFEELTWLKLKNLTLIQCFSERSAFVQFMERHSTTLSDLHLDQFTLTEKPAPLSIVKKSLFGVNYWGKYATWPALPETSWELAIRCLVRVLKLRNANLHNVDDQHLTRVSGSSIKARFISGETEANRWRFCGQLTRYLLSRGEGLHFPVYGRRQIAGCDCTICR